jgi:hypothetical protein
MRVQPATTDDAETLPDPSAELVLWRVSVQCFVAMVGRRKGERFLRLMAEKLAQEENMASVFSIRPHAQHVAVRRARKEAATVYERLLPIFLAGLADE